MAIAAILLAAGLAGCTATSGDTVAEPKPAGPTATAGTSAAGAPADTTTVGVPLATAVDRLPEGAEHRTRYVRTAFHIWIDADHDGCDTREEALIAQAVKPPVIGAGCKLTGGQWLSYYDDTTVTEPGKLDLDHVVPLAESWDSGAYAWTPERREAYANDLDGKRSLIAVTAHENRAKGDKDPAEWMPPAPDAQCTYLADWTAMKLRWRLTADPAEKHALAKLATVCPHTQASYTLAP